MTSTQSVLVDVAWGAGFLVLISLLVWQLRSWIRDRRQLQPLPPAGSAPEAPGDDVTVPVRAHLRCPQCARQFDALIDAEAANVVRCPSCSFSAPLKLEKAPTKPPAAFTVMEPTAGPQPTN